MHVHRPMYFPSQCTSMQIHREITQGANKTSNKIKESIKRDFINALCVQIQFLFSTISSIILLTYFTPQHVYVCSFYAKISNVKIVLRRNLFSPCFETFQWFFATGCVLYTIFHFIWNILPFKNYCYTHSYNFSETTLLAFY